MIFGQFPPPVEQDPVYNQPCFATQCNLGTTVGGPKVVREGGGFLL
jgi:hypothetical protein